MTKSNVCMGYCIQDGMNTGIKPEIEAKGYKSPKCRENLIDLAMNGRKTAEKHSICSKRQKIGVVLVQHSLLKKGGFLVYYN